MRNNVTVTIDLDTSQFVAAMEHARRSMASFAATLHKTNRIFWRSSLTAGELHVDRMCREVAGKPDAALRLFVAAACVAPVLDGEVKS